MTAFHAALINTETMQLREITFEAPGKYEAKNRVWIEKRHLGKHWEICYIMTHGEVMRAEA